MICVLGYGMIWDVENEHILRCESVVCYGMNESCIKVFLFLVIYLLIFKHIAFSGMI